MVGTLDQSQISPLDSLPARTAAKPGGPLPLVLTERTLPTAAADAPRQPTVQAEPPPPGKPLFRRFCGPAAVALGLAFTAAWIVFVGYGLLTLMGLAI